MKIFSSISVILLLLVSVTVAEEPKELSNARAKYEHQKPSEAARVQYILELKALRDKWAAADKGELKWKLADDEVKKHPVPASVDTAVLKKLFVGRWRSPRHDYQYRANGSWVMLPVEEDATHGSWKIKGNQYWSDDRKYTILLLDEKHFIFTDGEVVFYESRLAGSNTTKN